MLNIVKDMKNEPKSLKSFRLRNDIKKALKNNDSGMFDKYVDEYRAKELRDILGKEQGFICCYCMCSIENIKTKIEHYQSRENNHHLEVDYKNLYLACDGEKTNCTENQDKNENIHEDCKCKHDKNYYGEKDARKIKESHKKIIKHCDTCKGSRKIKFIKLNDIERYIKYKSDGTIYSDDENINEELNSLLNLNIEILKKSRLQAKKSLWRMLPKNQTWTNQRIEKEINKYKNRVKKAPYEGLLIYFLTKKLKQNEGKKQ